MLIFPKGHSGARIGVGKKDYGAEVEAVGYVTSRWSTIENLLRGLESPIELGKSKPAVSRIHFKPLLLSLMLITALSMG